LQKRERPDKNEKVSGMPSTKNVGGKAADTHSAIRGLRGDCLNSSHTLKHCGVISLGALSGLHLQKYDQEDTQPGDRMMRTSVATPTSFFFSSSLDAA
jgi:hypothetical protein